MSKLDRYFLSLLTGPFAIFSLILIGIYWVTRAIGLFDQLIGDGQSVGVFFEIMLLFLPQVVAISLPVVAFAAALYVANRLQSDSEMLVFQAAGCSPARLLRPFLIFGLLIMLLAASLSNYLVPVSQSRLFERLAELSEDMASRMVVGGRFLHPRDNVTFFVRELDENGALVDLFLHDQRDAGRDVTYTAHKAILFRKDDAARLVMFNGLIQTFDRDAQLLSKIQFDEFVFDIGSLTAGAAVRPRQVRDYSTLEALFPTPEMLRETGATAAAFKLEAHRRIEQPLQSLIYPLIGMLVLLSGSFSRFGVLRQMLAAVGAVIFLSLFSAPIRDMVAADAGLWWLIYLPDAGGAALVLWLLRRNQKPRRRRRAAAAEATA